MYKHFIHIGARPDRGYSTAIYIYRQNTQPDTTEMYCDVDGKMTWKPITGSYINEVTFEVQGSCEIIREDAKFVTTDLINQKDSDKNQHINSLESIIDKLLKNTKER